MYGELLKGLFRCVFFMDIAAEEPNGRLATWNGMGLENSTSASDSDSDSSSHPQRFNPMEKKKGGRQRCFATEVQFYGKKGRKTKMFLSCRTSGDASVLPVYMQWNHRLCSSGPRCARCAAAIDLGSSQCCQAEVGVGELEWDDTVAAYAKNYAKQRKADCSLQHSGGPYGENLFEEIGIPYAIRSCVTSWVEEKQYYDYDSNSCSEGQVCGHYTQVVWRDTVRLGCAPEVQCSNSSWFFFVCNYDPPGNIVGERTYVESAASKNVTAPPTNLTVSSKNVTAPRGNLTVSSKNMTKSPRSTNLTRVAGDLGNLTHSSGKTSSKLVPVLLGSAGGTALITTLCLVFRGRIKTWARTDKNLAAQGNFGQVIFDYKVLRGSTGNFDRNNMVGKGGFGEVYKGRFPDGSYVAVKKLNERQTTQAVEEFLTEVKLITSVRHRNLVRLLGCCTRGHKRLLVYEFMSNNSLDKHLFGEIRCALSWENRVNIIVGTARGLAYLHGDSNVRIIHRDIKCANILLDDKFHPKIADFGLARFFPENQTHVSTRVGGTIGYTAPEYAVHGQLTEKADVYSYGIVVLEISEREKVRRCKIAGPSSASSRMGLESIRARSSFGYC